MVHSAFFETRCTLGYVVDLNRFAANAALLCEPARQVSAIEEQLNRLRAAGTTKLAEAIDVACDALNVGPFPRAIVLVTDGVPDNKGRAFAAAKRARDSGIDIIAIGTGEADYEFLSTLTSRSNLTASVVRKELAQSIALAARMLPV